MKNYHLLAKTDLNLLVVFQTITETRQITRAAKLLNLTQPAISHALKRLRASLGDPLFVKTPDGMIATPFANSIAVPVREILQRLESEIFSRQPFSPATLRRTFHIRTTDLMESLLAPSLIQHLLKEAPEVNVSFTNTGYELPKTELETGVCDLAIAGFYGELPEGFYQQKLVQDNFSCAVNRKHTLAKKGGNLTLEEFSRQHHLLISPGGELTGAVDRALQAKKLQRTIVAGTSSFFVSGWVLAQTETILTAPSQLLNQLASFLPLRIFPLPLKLPDIRIVQVWHAVNHNDAAHQWFRQLIQQTLTRLKPT